MSFSLVGEIARKKLELEAARQQAGGGAKKYVRRGDIEKQRDAALAPSDAAAELSAPATAVATVVTVTEPKVVLKRSEVISRLRKLGQPVTFFAETDEERYKRLVSFEEEASGHDRSDVAIAGVYEFKGADGGASAGHKRGRADSEGGDLASPGEKAGGGFASRTGGAAGGDGADDGGDDDDDGHAAGGGARPRIVAADADGWKGKDDHKYVHRFFKGMLNEWEAALAAAPDDERESAAGRAERRTQKQTRDYSASSGARGDSGRRADPHPSPLAAAAAAVQSAPSSRCARRAACPRTCCASPSR